MIDRDDVLIRPYEEAKATAEAVRSDDQKEVTHASGWMLQSSKMI